MVHTNLQRLSKSESVYHPYNEELRRVRVGGVSQLAYSLSQLSWRIEVDCRIGFSSLSALSWTSLINRLLVQVEI